MDQIIDLGGGAGKKRKLDLGDVYRNEKAVLREITLRNGEEKPVLVKLSCRWEQTGGSDAPIASVHFQLSNENLKALAANVDPTAAASGFNELLNHAGVVHECFIEAASERKIVVVFYPCPFPSSGHSHVHHPDGSDIHGKEQLATATSFEVVKGWICVTPDPASTEASHDASTASQGVSIELRARMCRSILAADVTELQFLDCIPHTSYVKEFSIWNRSEIPLSFRLIPSLWLSPESGVLECSEYDTNAPLAMNAGRTISAYAHLRIRVAFKPERVGQRDFRIYIENMNDTTNTVGLDILTSVSLKAHQDGVLMETESGEKLGGGSVLNFGDCYAGVAVRKRLKLTNATALQLEVKLRSDSPAEVKFELDSEIEPKKGNRSKSRRLSDDFLSEKEVEAGDSTSTADESGKDREHRYSEAELDDEEEPEQEEYYVGTPGGPHDGDRDEGLSFPRNEEDDEEDDHENLVHQKRRTALHKPSTSDHHSRSGSLGPSGPDIEQSSRLWQAALERKWRERNGDADGKGSDPAALGEKGHRSHRRVSSEIEELRLQPGMQKLIWVRFCATGDVKTPREEVLGSGGGDEGTLVRGGFKLFFDCGVFGAEDDDQVMDVEDMIDADVDTFESPRPHRHLTGGDRYEAKSYSKAIVGRANICTSVIEVSKDDIDFGECNVEEYKSQVVTVSNHSDLPAMVVAHVISKVVTCTPVEMEIPAREEMPLKIEYVPRKPNSNYRKVISVMNCLNTQASKQINIRACNIDTHHVLYHSAFYKVIVKNRYRQKQVYFGHTVTSHPNLRTFTVQNVSDRPLLMELSSTSPQEIQLYTLSGEGSVLPTEGDRDALEATRDKFVEDMIWGSPVETGVNSDLLMMQGGARPGYHFGHSGVDEGNTRLRGMDLAVASGSEKFYGSGPGRTYLGEKMLVPTEGNVDVGLEALLSILEDEEGVRAPSVVGDQRSTLTGRQEAAAKHVALVRERTAQLRKAIASGRLKLLPEGQPLQIGQGSQLRLAVIMTVASSGGAEELQRERTVERQVLLRLVNVNSSHLPEHMQRPFGNPMEPLRVRGLLVRAKVCRSEMAIAQKNINFGRVVAGEFATRTVAIANRSPVPLLYSISKSRSISSGFLKIRQGRMGVVPPHGSREIEFAFRPSLAGAFEETFSVTNVQDETNTQIITIKAKVYKPDKFVLQNPPAVLPLGPCLVGDYAPSQHTTIALRNTTSRKRQFVVQAALQLLGDEGADGSAGDVSACFRFTLSTSSSGVTEEERMRMEEKLEVYRFKLRVAERKGKEPKVMKLQAKIERLRKHLAGEGTGAAGDAGELDVSLSESESDSEVEAPVRRHREGAGGAGRISEDPNSYTFFLEADTTASVGISVLLVAGARFTGWEGARKFDGTVKIYESRNEDVVKELPCCLSAFSSQAALADANRVMEQAAAQGPEGLRSPVPAAPTAEASGDGTAAASVAGAGAVVGAVANGDGGSASGDGKGAAWGSKQPFFLTVAPWCATKRGCGPREGVKIVVPTSAEATRASFSLHSLISADLIVKVLWDSGRGVGASFSAGGGSRSEVLVAVLHGEGTLDVSVELDLPLPPHEADAQELMQEGRQELGTVIAAPMEGGECREEFRHRIPVIAEPPQSFLDVEGKVDLGVIRLGETVSSSFRIGLKDNGRLPGGGALRYVVMLLSKPATNALVLTSQPTGTISDGEGVVFGLKLTATAVGRWTHTLMVRNLGNKMDQATVTLSASVQPPMYLHFPTLDPGMKGKLQDLEIGYCYMTGHNEERSSGVGRPDSGIQMVEPLKVKNVSKQRLYLTAIPNLRRQCFVGITSTNVHKRLVDYELAPEDILNLHIGLKPVLPADASETGDCRELVGGIRFLGFATSLAEGQGGVGFSEEELQDAAMNKLLDREDKLFELTVRFVGTAGVSILRLRTSPSRFLLVRGSAESSGETSAGGEVELFNASRGLPLVYRLLSPVCYPSLAADTARSQKLASMASGSAEMVLLSQETGTLAPLEKRVVQYCVLSKNFGRLFHATIAVENLSSRVHHAVLAHEMRIFFDSGALTLPAGIGEGKEAECASLMPHTLQQPEAIHMIFPVPISLPDAESQVSTVLRTVLQPLAGIPQRKGSYQYIRLVNTLGSAMQLVPYSDLPIIVRSALTSLESLPLAIVSQEAAPSPPSEPSGEGVMRCCGDSFALQAGEAVQLQVQFMEAGQTGALPPELVLSGSTIPIDGIVAFVCSSSSPSPPSSLPPQTYPCLDALSPPTGGASLAKLLCVKGVYCHPQLELQPPVLDLGRVGHTPEYPGRVAFSLTLRNLCDMDVPMCPVDLPAGLAVIDVPEVSQHAPLWVPPKGSCTVNFRYSLGNAWDGGYCERLRVRFENKLAPDGAVEAQVRLQVVTRLLHISDQEDGASGPLGKAHLRQPCQVELPPLLFPPSEDSGEPSKRVRLCNIGAESVFVSVSTAEAEDLGGMVELAVLSHPSSARLKTLKLLPGEEGIVQVVGKARPHDYLPPEWLRKSSETIPLGTVRFDISLGDEPTKLLAQLLEVLGRLTPADTLRFCTPLQPLSLSTEPISLAIENTCTTTAHRFNVVCVSKPSRRERTAAAATAAAAVAAAAAADGDTNAAEDSLTPLERWTAQYGADVLPHMLVDVAPQAESIAAKSCQTVSVALTDFTERVLHEHSASDGSDTSDALGGVCLMIEDACHPGYPPQYIDLCASIPVEEAEEEAASLPDQALSGGVNTLYEGAGDADQEPQPMSGKLKLRGVTPVAGDWMRYELNLGQQMVHAGGLEWELTICNESTEGTGYSLDSLNASDAEWLTLGRDRGWLGAGESHVITLYFSRSRMGVFSTHIIMRNSNNASDIKLMRVEMEVVQAEGIMAGEEKLFEVLVPPPNSYPRERLTLNFGDVYQGKLYRRRSFSIDNCSNMPLEFQLFSSLPATELSFSLSASSFEQVRGMTIEAHSRRQVYVYYRPAVSGRESSQVCEELCVTCRLVKDFQRVVTLLARCHAPQLRVTTVPAITEAGEAQAGGVSLAAEDSLLFVAPHAAEQGDLPGDFLEGFSTISNIGENVAYFVVASAAQFFSVEPASSTEEGSSKDAQQAAEEGKGWKRLARPVPYSDSRTFNRIGWVELQGGASLTLRIAPDMKALLAGNNPAMLDGAQYIEDHLSIYNARQPAEMYQLGLKLTSGVLRAFSLAPGPRNAYPFHILEDNISSFLQAWHMLWKSLLEELQLTGLLEGQGKAQPPKLKDSELSALVQALDQLNERSSQCSAESLAVSAGASSTDSTRSATGMLIDALAAQLLFELCYITDELLHYSLMHEGAVGDFALRLANLVFSVAFRHPVFAVFQRSKGQQGARSSAIPAMLSKFVLSLDRFLGFFPSGPALLQPLLRIHEGFFWSPDPD